MPVTLEIVSPERLLLSRPVDMAVIPAYEGDLAAMPNHAPMIVMLRGGVVALHEGDRVTDRFFVTSGFAEITADRCTVLADEAVSLADLTRADAEKRVAEAEAGYDSVDKLDIAAREAAMDRLLAARAMLQAASAA
ncbi:MAG TPA: ATP synthase F1 subunit epsilon [Acetobacteraceae bacterium]|nr:ATP synthase F1 subunit epsilon [Acetobacteraceae bacterium]